MARLALGTAFKVSPTRVVLGMPDDYIPRLMHRSLEEAGFRATIVPAEDELLRKVLEVSTEVVVLEARRFPGRISAMVHALRSAAATVETGVIVLVERGSLAEAVSSDLSGDVDLILGHDIEPEALVRAVRSLTPST